MAPPNIKTKPIQPPEFHELVAFDQIHLQKGMLENGVTKEQLPPQLTLSELEAAHKRNDVLVWVLVDNETVGYYWFEKQRDCLYIGGIAIRKEYQGLGIAHEVLRRADEIAKNNRLLQCKLSVTPLNGRALNFYFKHGYSISDYTTTMFNIENLFRLIMTKNLSQDNKIQSSPEEIIISCNEFVSLKNTIDKGYIGIRLLRHHILSNNKVSQNKILFVKHSST